MRSAAVRRSSAQSNQPLRRASDADPIQRTGLSSGTALPRRKSLRDPLTGLPNRAAVLAHAEQLLRHGRRLGTELAVLVVAVDDFKDVNHTLGHEAGDQLLVSMANRLQASLRRTDTIGRIGGDEFAVLFSVPPSGMSPQLVAARLLQAMKQPFDLDDTGLLVEVSIGVATGDRTVARDLLRDADLALQQAKVAGKNRYEIFDAARHAQLSHRAGMRLDLRAATVTAHSDQHQYRLVYQPVYDLSDLRMVGAEALLRWQHPTRGTVHPSEFVPILEQTGQIVDVGRWALRKACRQMAAWRRDGAELAISVNVSARQFDGDHLVYDIADALCESDLPPSALTIEVTETALMRDVEQTVRLFSAIRQLGVRVAIDDFGTGYSSLAYLLRLPVDCLKIDRVFTSAITTSPEWRSLIATFVRLGHDLGLTTLAEGVESTAEIDALHEEHVDKAQGFLLARPIDASTFSSVLAAGRNVA